MLKRIISGVLAFVLALSVSVQPVWAAEIYDSQLSDKNYTELYLKSLDEALEENLYNDESYTQLALKFIDKLENDIEPSTILQELTSDELQTLKDYHHSLVSETSTQISFFNIEKVESDEMASIDILAQEYYDYYVEYGSFPNTMTRASSSDVVTALEGLGYYFTKSQIAEQLASLGLLCQIDGPLPVLDLLCIIAGVAVISIYAIDYYTNADDVNSSILSWYGSDISEYTSEAEKSTAKVVEGRSYGIYYWKAYLIDPRGLGGIAIGEPLDYDMALRILQYNQSSLNIYSLQRAYARKAAGDSFGYGYISHSAHTTNGKIMNLPHYHAKTDSRGTEGKGHSFFSYN